MKGTVVSKGICIAEPFIIQNNKCTIINNETENYLEEHSKFKKALKDSISQLGEIVKLVKEEIGTKESNIFDAQITMLEDATMQNKVENEIKKGHTAEAAVCIVKNEIMDIFNSMENQYMKNKALDIKDIMERIVFNILNIDNNTLELEKPVIVIAEDLTPSQTINFGKNIKGIITEKGSGLSHTAILAKSMNIPAVVGMGKTINDFNETKLLILDTLEEKIISNPDDNIIKKYNEKINKINKENKESFLKNDIGAITKEGIKISINANIGSINELEQVKKYKAEGIGLLRTEFLYMNNKDFPCEEEQFSAYKNITLNGGNEVILRTLDIGGDKELPYYKFKNELNPFLGNRSIRFALERKDIFKVQLRAILRASAYGNLKIMYPMITKIEEIEEANSLLIECMKELDNENIKYNKNIQVGIMIETPAAALTADKLAKKCDFFSIGTNDLFQYTMAVDRTNYEVCKLYINNNEAIFKLIKMTYEAAINNNIEISVCGEMAAQPNAIKELISIGIRKLSMSPSLIPEIKNEIAKI